MSVIGIDEKTLKTAANHLIHELHTKENHKLRWTICKALDIDYGNGMSIDLEDAEQKICDFFEAVDLANTVTYYTNYPDEKGDDVGHTIDIEFEAFLKFPSLHQLFKSLHFITYNIDDEQFKDQYEPLKAIFHEVAVTIVEKTPEYEEAYYG